MATTESTTRRNKLTIHDAQHIEFVNPAGPQGGTWAWTGQTLTFARKSITFSPEMTAEITAAVAAARPARWEYASGAQIVGQDGWEFLDVENDAVGIYSRKVEDAVSMTVWFGRDDVVAMS